MYLYIVFHTKFINLYTTNLNPKIYILLNSHYISFDNFNK